jgi:hypothetical protein
VRELEARFKTLNAFNTQPPSGTIIWALNIDNESSVDAVATNTFNETPQSDIGYFGKLNIGLFGLGELSHALFRILSSGAIKVLPPACQLHSHATGRFMHSMSAEPSLSSVGPAAISVTPHVDTSLAPIGLYELPSSQVLNNFLNGFFTTIGTIHTYIDESSL